MVVKWSLIFVMLLYHSKAVPLLTVSTVCSTH